ncbi:MAG TPA: murein biosynthesis integral membrane protein MurJ [Candidatus Limnocylindrales bacterium]|nr:murein biosynthesis integral membrane protein MurJ [Candidatus Limnocylindrales bacterium]
MTPLPPASPTPNTLNSRQISRAVLIVLLGFLGSGVLGLVRTMLFGVTFGASAELDAYYAAQRLPELLYTLVAGGALGSSFIPVFARFLTKGDEAGAWRLASAVLTLAMAAAGVLALVLALLAPWFVPNVLVLGVSPEQAALTTQMTQIMLVTVVIFTASGLLMGILNAHQLFLLPSLALIGNNLGQILGGLVAFAAISLFEIPPAHAIYALAAGAVLGSLLHLGIQLPGLRKVGARLAARFDTRTAGAREVLLLMLPRVFGLAMVQINFTVNVILTSMMIEGSLSALNVAWMLMFFALGVIAQSVGTAVFPTLSALAAANDMPVFRQRLAGAMRGVLFLAFPATVVMVVLGETAVRALFEHGNWTPENTAAAAWALTFFALGIAAHSLLEVLSRAFYALADTWTPVSIGVLSILANIVLSVLLMRVMGDPDSLARGPFAGLALANSLTTIAEALVLWLLLRRRIGGGNDATVVRGGVAALAAALGMGVVMLLVRTGLEGQSPWLALFAALAAGGVTFFGLALLLGIEEARTVPGMVLRRVRR